MITWIFAITLNFKTWTLRGYFKIREDWKFVAMVVDRAQLWIFFLVTTIGTIGILMDAPHMFEFVDQDRIIDIYRGKWKVISIRHQQCIWWCCAATAKVQAGEQFKNILKLGIHSVLNWLWLRLNHFEDILTKWK